MDADTLQALVDQGASDFVILHHRDPGPGREDHWDLMFRVEQHLVTFQIAQNCLVTSEQEVVFLSHFQATQLPDHRLAYLEYEGAVSRNRGSVQRLVRGSYRCHWVKNHPVSHGETVCQVSLKSAQLAGQLHFFAKNSLNGIFNICWTADSPAN